MAFPAAIEVDRRLVQLEQDARRLDGAWFPSHVFACEAAEIELASPRALPQKVGFHAFGEALSLREELAGSGVLEAE